MLLAIENIERCERIRNIEICVIALCFGGIKLFHCARYDTGASASIACTMDQLYSQVWREINTTGSDVEWDFFCPRCSGSIWTPITTGSRRGRKGQNRSSRVNVIAPRRVHVVYVRRERYIEWSLTGIHPRRDTRNYHRRIWHDNLKNNQLSIRKNHFKRVRQNWRRNSAIHNFIWRV